MADPDRDSSLRRLVCAEANSALIGSLAMFVCHSSPNGILFLVIGNKDHASEGCRKEATKRGQTASEVPLVRLFASGD